MHRTALALKSLSRLKVPISYDQLGRQTGRSETLKCASPDDENLDIQKFKKTHLGEVEREPRKGLEVRIGGNPKCDNCEELISKRLRGISMAGRGSQNMIDQTVGRLLMVST